MAKNKKARRRGKKKGSNQLHESIPPLNEVIEIGRSTLFDKEFHFDGSCFTEVDDGMLKSLCSENQFEVPSALQQCKARLNNTRSMLDDFDITIWHENTSFNNHAGEVMREIRKRFSPELCTQAWAKIMEILYKFQPVRSNSNDGKFKSLHLCEAPGAFVAATNHYIRQRQEFDHLQWDWAAVTFNPYHEGNDKGSMIDDDLFIFYTLDHWWFGEDNTGNIMSPRNFEGFIQKSRERFGEVDFVTADGSIDCSSEPNEQEKMVHHLHFAETVMALATLAKNGTFALKIFTFFECCTANLLFLLGSHFQQLHLFKPATSKGGNSETYAIACGFKGIHANLLSRLISLVVEPVQDRSLFKYSDFTYPFWECMASCANKLANHQIELIERNLALFYQKTKADEYHIRRVRKEVAEEYIHRYQVKQIEESKKIVPNVNMEVTQLNTSSIVWGPSYGKRGRPGGTLEARKERKQQHNRFINRGNADSDSEDHKSPPDATKVSTYSATAMKLMNAMGHQMGKGLGKHENGVVNPYEQEQMPNRAGLGFIEPTWKQQSNFLPDGPFFEYIDGGADPLSFTSDASITPLWGPSITFINTSPFCRLELLKDRLSSKRQWVGAKAKNGDSFLESRANLFHGVYLGSMSFCKTPFVPFFAQMNKVHGLFVRAQPNKIVDLTDSGGFHEYSEWIATIAGYDVCVESVFLSSAAFEEEVAQNQGTIDVVACGKGSWQIERIDMNGSSTVQQKEFLGDLSAALKLLKRGGKLILLMDCALDRFSVGVVFIISQLFDQIYVQKPFTLPPDAPICCVIASNLKDQPAKLNSTLETLDHCIAQLSKIAEEECQNALLELISISDLLAPAFINYLVRANDRFINREIIATKLLVEQLDKPKLSPPELAAALDLVFSEKEIQWIQKMQSSGI